MSSEAQTLLHVGVSQNGKSDANSELQAKNGAEQYQQDIALSLVEDEKRNGRHEETRTPDLYRVNQ
jgi:hypothetical protein